MKYLQFKLLKQASKALERAASSAWHASLLPNTTASPCEEQMKVAQAEVACALALIKQAEYQ